MITFSPTFPPERLGIYKDYYSLPTGATVSMWTRTCKNASPHPSAMDQLAWAGAAPPAGSSSVYSRRLGKADKRTHSDNNCKLKEWKKEWKCMEKNRKISNMELEAMGVVRSSKRAFQVKGSNHNKSLARKILYSTYRFQIILWRKRGAEGVLSILPNIVT